MQLLGGFGFGFGFVAATISGVRGVAAADTGIALAARADQPAGTATRDALTDGCTTGLLGAGAFHLAAIVAAALPLRPRSSARPRSRPRLAKRQRGEHHEIPERTGPP